ncbi:ABATE domain-containing protein [Ensifer adhaerens]|uniref:CGNR zinc finger domain-containing protein n=1 Tax=Ensifer adhaerens TaxID=106592 RepID=UPI0023A97D59|nr:ABATE domain-containing protein [Ensifer adhaerens]WDZ77629.1 ABATE domain-containing protein [Ensifer adhaerens]
MDVSPFVGEPLALDLVNTRPQVSAEVIDLIADGDGLRAWVELEKERLAGVPSDELAAISTDELEQIHSVRACLAMALDHQMRGLAVPARAIEGLNAAMRAAPAIHRLDWGDPPIVETRREGSAAAALAALLAEDAAAMLAGPQRQLIRKCEADDCVMLFVGNNARRRWCSTTRCGNRVRVSRYYQRSKAS